MPSTEYILQRLQTPTREDLEVIAYGIGELVALADGASLSPIYDQLRELRARLRVGDDADLAMLAMVNVLRLAIEGYFATREGIDRVQRLAKEVAQDPRWQAMLAPLLGPSIPSRAIASKADWDELRRRELAELVPIGNDYGYQVTRLGRKVWEAVQAAQGKPR